MLQPARRKHAQERFLGSRPRFRQRSFEVSDIVGYFLLADVADGSVADGTLRRQEPFEIEILVKLRELQALAGVAAHPPGFARLDFARPQARQPPAIIREAEAGFAQLAVADDVDARVGLSADHLGHAGAIQASRVRSENSFGAVFHASHSIAPARLPS